MISVGLWFFFGCVSPRLVPLIPAWQRYAEVQEETGLNSGALYYTDVPVSLECERANRAAVAAALELRRQAADRAAAERDRGRR